MTNARQISLILAVLLGLALYLFLFFGTGMPDFKDSQGQAMSRAMVWSVYLLRPDDLVTQWTGTPAECSLVERLPVLAIAGGILGFAGILGWLLMAIARADRGLSRVERLVFSMAVGLNAVSTYVLLVGLIGELGSLVIFAMPAALVLVLAGMLSWYRRPRRKPGAAGGGEVLQGLPRSDSQKTAVARRAGKEPVASAQRRSKPAAALQDAEGKTSAGWLWLAVPFVLVIVLGGMLPPIEFDVREYHLQVPKEFYQQGRITFLPHNVYGNMPMGTEMLSLLSMVLARDWWLGALAGKTVSALFAPLTALGLWAAGRRLASPLAGIVAAVLYLSTAWIVQVSTLGLIDGVLACYLFLAVYAVLLYMAPAGKGEESGTAGESPKPNRDWTRLILAGYLAGGAVSTKYPAALFVAIPLTLWILWLHFRPGWPAPWKPMTALLVALVVGCGLWFGKNWALADNPTYPLLYEVLGGKTWSPEKNEQWNRVHRPHDFSLRALGNDLARVTLTSPWLNPLLVPLAALALASRRHRRLALMLIGYFAFVIAVWWLLTHRIDRFWIPAMPVLALLAGIGAVWTNAPGWRKIILGLLVLASVGNFVVASSSLVSDNRWLVSLAKLREDPLRVDAWHRYYNTHAPAGRLLLVGEAQVFDLEPPILYNTCFDTCIFEQLVRNHSPEQIRQAMNARNITDVYVSWGEIDRYRRTYGFTDFVQPEVFQWLVERGVLEPLPEIPQHSGRGYRVLKASERLK